MATFAYLGTHPVGIEVLRRLASHPDATVTVVVSYPPKEDNWWPGSVYREAEKMGLQVRTIADEESILEYDIDYILSVYYPNILSAELLDHPHRGSLNLHLAELPRYRGSNVFAHSIMNARDDDHWRHGATLHFMTEELDAGDIIDRRFVNIFENDTARDLYERTIDASIELFTDTLPKILSGKIKAMRTSQDSYECKQYFYRKNSLEGLEEIDLGALSDPDRTHEMYDRIRALEFPPHNPAFVKLDGRRINLTLKTYFTSGIR